RKQFRLGRTKLRWAAHGDVNPLQRMLDGSRRATYGPADVRFLQGLYDGDIAYFDDQLGKLVARLREGGLLERTILVVLADHGESFDERGNASNCLSVYNSEVKTPLPVRLPR